MPVQLEGIPSALVRHPVIAETAPDWFRRALDVPFDEGEVEVEGAAVHYLAWGERGRPGAVFVHGGGAHAHWWSHVAGLLAHDFRVAALDLSGHGDSGTRGSYSVECWGEEVVAAARAAEIGGGAVVVGHSMGGFVAVTAAARHPGPVAGVILCDSPITPHDPELDPQRVQAFGRGRTYRSLPEALREFRIVPPQAHYLDYLVDHVARRSLHHVAGGWKLKFDRRIFEQYSGGMRSLALPYLPQVQSPFALLRSEYGLVTPAIAASMVERLGRRALVVEIPLAGHHAMLDQPLLLVVALRTLLGQWLHGR